MKNIQTEIIINASAEKVWNILTDFAKYHEWNPFIRSSEGEAKVGTKLKNTMHLEGQKPQTFTPTILEVTPNQSFRWLGSLFFKGLFDGEHYFRLEPINEHQVKFLHGENFSGILVGMVMKMIGAATQQGFLQMNEALKARAEGK
ncbi:MAG: SRPBCC domain-containing protein [Saprospiraceae bacterium]|nr:SRPBCC domain-containing protein [Saprospiraceae bacterium]